ncbi:MAG: PAC2 family protein, partial [Chloroflexota bacterium]|nr:PAC2 family protein [Chloroflexota bacterium]
DLAQQFGVKRVISVGGVLGGVPHTKEPTVSCTISDARLKAEMGTYAVRFSNYEGPSTFNAMLVAMCRERGLEAIQLTGRAIFYPDFNIVVKRDARAMYAILVRLRRLLGIDLDLSDLRKEGQELAERLDLMVSQNPRLSSYIRELERSFEEIRYEEPLKGTPEDFVRDAEEFLRRQHEKDA